MDAPTKINCVHMRAGGPRCSGRLAMVISQDPTQPLTAADAPCGPPDFFARLHDPVGHALMIPLTVVMNEEFEHGRLQRWLAKEDHPMQAFVLDCPHEPLDVRGQIG